jgi:hypothetical protein
MKAYTTGVNSNTTNLLGIAVVESPFPDGKTYIFYFNSSQILCYLVGNVIQGGANSYKDSSITVNTKQIDANSENAPLAAVRTSDGKVSNVSLPKDVWFINLCERKIHVFYPDNKNSRALSEIIFDMQDETWTAGTIQNLGLKLHEESGLSASSAPVLKVDFQSTSTLGQITEARWNTVSLE